MNYITKSDVCVPMFWITKNKNRLKIYDQTNVYLNDGDNFEIELYNPTKLKVKCEIFLNGDLISTSGLVLNPGQRYYLERFIDTNNKFIFGTYNVSDNETNKDAIKDNGLVHVNFYREYVPFIFNLGTGNGITWLTTPNYQYYGSNIANNTLNIGNSGVLRTANFSNINSIETGRIEKGDESNQSFSNDYGSYETYVTKSFSYKILPVSRKLIETKEIKNYCVSCGTRIRHSNWKFCPSCGEKI